MELAGLRATVDAERHGLYESVFRAFDSLLRVTSPRKNQAAGPKSLLAMCLRKVPAYIAELEEWERRDSEENGTKSAVQGAGVSFEIYSELESLGAVDGWRHLCLLARAHGVHMIQDAASEGLLEDPVTALLIRLCLEYMPAMECMDLLKIYLYRQYPKPQPANDDLFSAPALRPLQILRCCDPTGTTLMPRMLADLLADGLLPADWILTARFADLWPATVRLLTQTKPCPDAVDFVVTGLELLCDMAAPTRPRGIPQTRVRGKPQNTLISIVAALGSLVLLSEDGLNMNAECSAARSETLKRRIEYVTATCSERLRHRRKGGRKFGTYILALCAFLSLETVPASAAVVETAWKGVKSCRGNPNLMLQYDATAALMSHVAYHCGRGIGLAPHVYLSRLCDKLETLDLPGGALSNMRVDGAFRLAEHTGDLRDLAYAESLRATVAAGCSTPEQTRNGGVKRKVSSFSGIRWDDGISEWVAATPATDLRPTGRFPRLRSKRMGMEQAENASDTNQHDEADAGWSSEGESAGSASETDGEDETISPNTEASSTRTPSEPKPGSESESESEPEPEPEPESDLQSDLELQPELRPPHPEDDNNHDYADDDSGNPASPASPADPLTQSPPPAPPAPPLPKQSSPPAGGRFRFLAARPRRLSRRITIAITPAGDELALDGPDITANDNADHADKHDVVTMNSWGGGGGGESWLGRKKPARFSRPAGLVSSSTSTPPLAAAASAAATSGCSNSEKGEKKTKKKRVARASLVYLRPVSGASRAARERGGEEEGVGGGSDDELSFL
ncbi:549f8137-d5ff-47e5-a952-475907ae4f30 [Thermothielavioides terrestris]|uniref:Uncharacterized protein n=2 Tax=Thermothielavioides terrestris TaxID=2587410 RepID=G2RBK5_THETT|nr:uncharacterized protein THITE_2119288 [Thermothielavioides terrestris NRRL 8126]AEO69176.1 hypothetical protein THITE_2119288 [Thermothielavioides terrestris NRRL 8126]SPQ22545.1 549f8137-d5ff-47e5-a952-475907ae4f30 [Thermothielavioides terrestris]